MGDTHGEPSHIVCGYLGCDGRPFNPLLAALPRVIHLSDRAGGAIGAFVQFAIAEARERRPGGEAVLGHLSELMFVDVVRRYLETLPPDRTGWLAALREPFVGRALSRRCIAAPPRLDPRVTGARSRLSRSALAERFTQFVGQPPMQYLTNWRMQLAANQLLAGTDGVAGIAERVGYESEAAFRPGVQEDGRYRRAMAEEARPGWIRSTTPLRNRERVEAMCRAPGCTLTAGVLPAAPACSPSPSPRWQRCRRSTPEWSISLFVQRFERSPHLVGAVVKQIANQQVGQRAAQLGVLADHPAEAEARVVLADEAPHPVHAFVEDRRPTCRAAPLTCRCGTAPRRWPPRPVGRT